MMSLLGGGVLVVVVLMVLGVVVALPVLVVLVLVAVEVLLVSVLLVVVSVVMVEACPQAPSGAPRSSRRWAVAAVMGGEVGWARRCGSRGRRRREGRRSARRGLCGGRKEGRGGAGW